MNVPFLLSRLQANHVELLVDGDDLRLRAPRGALNAQMIEIVRANKREIREELIKPSCLGNPTSRGAGSGFATSDRHKGSESYLLPPVVSTDEGGITKSRTLKTKTLRASSLLNPASDSSDRRLGSSGHPDPHQSDPDPSWSRKGKQHFHVCLAEAVEVARCEARAISLGLEPQFGHGPVGAALEAFADCGLELVGVTKEGEPLTP